MLTLFSLLSDASSNVGGGNKSMMWIMLVIFAVLLVVMMYTSNRANKKRQKEAEEKLNNMRVGDRVKTIGGICGIIVEINDEENTFVIKTGLNDEGNYIKFDKIAVYQTSRPEEAVNEDAENTDAVAVEQADEAVEAVQQSEDAAEVAVVEGEADKEVPENA